MCPVNNQSAHFSAKPVFINLCFEASRRGSTLVARPLLFFIIWKVTQDKKKKKYIDVNNMFIKLKCVIGCIWRRLCNGNDAARGAAHVVFEMENNKKRPCQRVLRWVLSATTLAGWALYLSSLQTKFVAANWFNSRFFLKEWAACVK